MSGMLYAVHTLVKLSEEEAPTTLARTHRGATADVQQTLSSVGIINTAGTLLNPVTKGLVFSARPLRRLLPLSTFAARSLVMVD